MLFPTTNCSLLAKVKNNMKNKYKRIRSACISLLWLMVFAISLTRLLDIAIPDVVIRILGVVCLVTIPVLFYSTNKMYKK